MWEKFNGITCGIGAAEREDGLGKAVLESTLPRIFQNCLKNKKPQMQKPLKSSAE